MDKTSVWNNMIAETVSRKGEMTISLKSTGHGKVLVSVCLAARGRDEIEAVCCLPWSKNGSCGTNDEFKNKCVVATSINAWKNEELTLKWIQQVFS